MVRLRLVRDRRRYTGSLRTRIAGVENKNNSPKVAGKKMQKRWASNAFISTAIPLNFVPLHSNLLCDSNGIGHSRRKPELSKIGYSKSGQCLSAGLRVCRTQAACTEVAVLIIRRALADPYYLHPPPLTPESEPEPLTFKPNCRHP
jgi:hypothetical protein